MRNILRERLKLNKSYAGDFISDWDIVFYMTALFLTGMAIGMIFYNHLFGSLIMGCVMQIFLPECLRSKLKKIQIRLVDEFMIFNNIMLGEISGFSSVENIYRKMGRDLKNNKIMGVNLLKGEFEMWASAVELGENPENLLMNFAARLGDTSILQYAFVFKMARKQGVDLKIVISTTNQILREKIGIARDIDILVSEKKLEQKIMSIMPFLMLLFLKYTAFDFISPLYEGLIGRGLMSILLTVFGICYIWSNRMTNIV